MNKPVDLDYRARRILVRPVFESWLASLPENCAVEKSIPCPACSGNLTMKRGKSSAPGVKAETSARCTAPFCVKL